MLSLQNLRSVQSKIQEIERLPTKSAKDENELAQLHVKQQQILASGRHVPSQTVQEVFFKTSVVCRYRNTLCLGHNFIVYDNACYLHVISTYLLYPNVCISYIDHNTVYFCLKLG